MKYIKFLILNLRIVNNFQVVVTDLLFKITGISRIVRLNTTHFKLLITICKTQPV